MTAVTSRPRPARAGPRDNSSRRRRRQFGRVECRGGGESGSDDHDPRRPIVLRCPGPLVALRGLAALYGVSAQRLVALLPACETQAGTEPHAVAGALRAAVSDALGAPPRTPTSVHYFHATLLRDPQLILEHGVRPSPAGALHRGPRGCLVRDLLLRPSLYGAHDHLRLPALVRDARATTPCIVEYRGPPARDGHDIDAALWFVAAGLRGTTSPWAVRGHDGHGTPIAARDIVSVRAISSQNEWSPEHRSR